MKGFGKVKAVHVFSPEFIAIDFEERSLTYRKGQNYYQTVHIEPVTGIPINTVVSIDRGEFLDNLLEILAEANIKRQLEKAPLGNIVKIRAGTQSCEVVMNNRKDAKWFAKHLASTFKHGITKPEFETEYKASFKNKHLPDDYLDALRYMTTTLDRDVARVNEGQALYGTGMLKLPEGYSVNYRGLKL